ncbi:MAG: integrase core domain-containing protein, partial [Lachnospiraceae bacterium]
ARFFFSDNAINFQQVWKSAVLRYGKSKVMILDNGSTYKNRWNDQISSSLGTQLIYNPPYSPTGKALIERFFRTIKDRWLNCEHGRNFHSLDELNSRLNQWISEYNRTEHRALENDLYDNHTPLQRFMYDMKDVEPWKTVNKTQLEFSAWVDECFLYEEIRKVNGDSTVVINKISFDVPSRYIQTSVIIRYDPLRYKNVYLFDPANRLKVPLKRTDKIENGKTRRTSIIY